MPRTHRSYRYSLPINNLGAGTGWVFSATYRPHYPQERDQVTIVGHRTEILFYGRLRLKCDGTRAETRFRLSAKWTSPFRSAGASVRSTTGSQGVRFSRINAEYTMFRGSVKNTRYPLHSPISPFTSPPVRHRVPSHFNWTLHNFSRKT